VFSAKFKCLGKCWQVFGGLSDGRSKRLVSVCVLPWKVRGPLPRVGFKGIWASGLPPAGPTLRRARLRCRARGIPANHAAARQSPPATYGRDRSWVGLARRLQKVRGTAARSAVLFTMDRPAASCQNAKDTTASRCGGLS
jgi:hypothetical protein